MTESARPVLFICHRLIRDTYDDTLNRESAATFWYVFPNSLAQQSEFRCETLREGWFKSYGPVTWALVSIVNKFIMHEKIDE